MARGLPLNRQWVFVTRNGIIAYDWGNGYAQDLVSGEFFPMPEANAYDTADEKALMLLVQMGVAEAFDNTHLYVHDLPTRPLRSLD